MAGYPEALPADEDNDPRYGAYNSAVICGPSGEYIGGGRKTNMYEADLPWCKPGTLLRLTTDSVLIHHQVTGMLTSNSHPPLSDLSPSASVRIYAHSHRTRTTTLLHLVNSLSSRFRKSHEYWSFCAPGWIAVNSLGRNGI